MKRMNSRFTFAMLAMVSGFSAVRAELPDGSQFGDPRTMVTKIRTAVAQIPAGRQHQEDPNVHLTQILVGNWVTDVQRASSNRQFNEIASKGYEIEVTGCAFNTLRKQTIAVRLKPAANKLVVHTEAFVPYSWDSNGRIEALRKQGYEVAIVCTSSFGVSNTGFVIQYWVTSDLAIKKCLSPETAPEEMYRLGCGQSNKSL